MERLLIDLRHTPPGSAGYRGDVKKEDALYASNTSTFPSLSNTCQPRYGSPERDSPPPPPAAYTVPSEEDEISKHIRSTASRRKYQSYDDDPIPPPPEKYSYPLPSISEALMAREIERPSIHTQEPVSSYRRYSNDSQSADRYTQSREYQADRATVRTPYTGQPTMPSSAVAPPYEAERYSLSSNPRPHHPVQHGRALPEALNHRQSPPPVSPSGEQWRPGRGPPPSEGHYYSQYAPAAPYVPRRAPSRDVMPPPPVPSTTTIYAPSLSNPRPRPRTSTGALPSPGYRDEMVTKSRKPIYGESVKRHLDTFDLESALNMVRIT